MRDSDLNFIQNQLQFTVNNLTDWAQENGFRFSTSKTVMLHFTRKRPRKNPLQHPKITLADNLIQRVESHRILGLIFDQKLTWSEQINTIKQKTIKRFNLLKCLAGKHWGADQNILLRIYQLMILSVMEYGVDAYGSAKPKILAKLDPLHFQGLRIALGAFRTTRRENLLCEAGMTSLEHRRQLSTIKTAIKIMAILEHPVRKKFIDPDSYDQYAHINQNTTFPFYIRAQNSCSELSIDLQKTQLTYWPLCAPWTNKPSINLDLLKFPKGTNPIIIKQNFAEMINSDFLGHEHIFTDGSSMDDRSGYGVVFDDETIKVRLPNEASVFSAEMSAIMHATEIISKSERKYFTIFTDSLSSLQAMDSSTSLSHPVCGQLLDKISDLSKHKNITFTWVPSHVGIAGNELADIAAKDALNLEIQPNTGVTKMDLTTTAKRRSKDKWNQIWENSNNIMTTFKKTTERWRTTEQLNRRQQVILSRLRMCHTRITHSYHIEKTNRPVCETCQADLTVPHILFDCQKYESARRSFNISRRSMDEARNILLFIESIKISNDI
jgi:ribonuclease HI